MSTRRSSDEDMDWQCDHGAQYFTASNTEFRSQVSAWEQAGAAQVWQAASASTMVMTLSCKTSL